MQFQKYKNTFFAISKMAKNNFLQQKKSLKNYQILSCSFFQSENWIFGSFKNFSGAKIDFLPLLKWQITLFALLKITHSAKAASISNELVIFF